MDPSVLPLLSYFPPLFPIVSFLFSCFPFFVSFLGHRSSPPHIRDTQSSSYFAQAPQASVPPTPTDSASRQSSRFDRSANPLQQSSRSRNHDVYIPTDALPQKGERELELTSTQISAEHGTKRKRPADESIHTRGDSRGVAAPTEVLVPTIPPERPASGSSSSHTEQSRTCSPALDYSILHKPMLVYVIFRSLSQANGRDCHCHLRVHDSAKCHARIRHHLLSQFRLGQETALPVLNRKDLLTLLTVIFLQAHVINLNLL